MRHSVSSVDHNNAIPTITDSFHTKCETHQGSVETNTRSLPSGNSGIRSLDLKRAFTLHHFSRGLKKKKKKTAFPLEV